MVVFHKEVIVLFEILIHVIHLLVIIIQQQKLQNFQIHIKIIPHKQVQELLLQKQNLMKIIKLYFHQKKIWKNLKNIIKTNHKKLSIKQKLILKQNLFHKFLKQKLKK